MFLTYEAQPDTQRSCYIFGRNSMVDFSKLVLTNECKIFAGAKILKGSIQIYPFGMVSLLKDDDGKKNLAGSKVVVTYKKGRNTKCRHPSLSWPKQVAPFHCFFG